MADRYDGRQQVLSSINHFSIGIAAFITFAWDKISFAKEDEEIEISSPLTNNNLSFPYPYFYKLLTREFFISHNFEYPANFPKSNLNKKSWQKLQD